MRNHWTGSVHYESYDQDQTQFGYEFLQARTQKGCKQDQKLVAHGNVEYHKPKENHYHLQSG